MNLHRIRLFYDRCPWYRSISERIINNLIQNAVVYVEPWVSNGHWTLSKSWLYRCISASEISIRCIQFNASKQHTCYISHSFQKICIVRLHLQSSPLRRTKSLKIQNRFKFIDAQWSRMFVFRTNLKAIMRLLTFNCVYAMPKSIGPRRLVFFSIGSFEVSLYRADFLKHFFSSTLEIAVDLLVYSYARANSNLIVSIRKKKFACSNQSNK